MPADFDGAVRQLVALLRRYFRPSGAPPQMPEWTFPARGRRGSGSSVKGKAALFSALLTQPPADRAVAEAVARLQPLQETRDALRAVHSLIEAGGATERFAFTFDALLREAWVASRIEASEGSQRWIGYRFRCLDERLLSQLLEAATDAQARTPADSGEMPQQRFPDNPDVLDLCKRLAERKPGESQMAVATRFVQGDVDKARSLLRQARRYRHLWGADT